MDEGLFYSNEERGMMNAEWYILRLGNWKVTVTSLPDSAAARRD
jgi:hypothetical protein